MVSRLSNRVRIRHTVHVLVVAILMDSLFPSQFHDTVHSLVVEDEEDHTPKAVVRRAVPVAQAVSNSNLRMVDSMHWYLHVHVHVCSNYNGLLTTCVPPPPHTHTHVHTHTLCTQARHHLHHHAEASEEVDELRELLREPHVQVGWK